MRIKANNSSILENLHQKATVVAAQLTTAIHQVVHYACECMVRWETLRHSAGTEKPSFVHIKPKIGTDNIQVLLSETDVNR